ncbi:MAG TPA: hypothetical protein VIR98_02160 [Candidatus Paceibacterota bacterium]|jgi:hypothetical protein
MKKISIVLVLWVLFISDVSAQALKPELTVVDDPVMFVGSRVNSNTPVDIRLQTPKVIDQSMFGLVSGDVGLTYGLNIGPGEANIVYLVRALGPSLKKFDISGYLERPQITVTRNGKLFMTIGYWADLAPIVSTVIPTMRKAEQMAKAIPLELGLFDAAAIVSLPEGTYTFTVEGDPERSSNREGKTLFQIYELPELVEANRTPSIPQLLSFYEAGSLSVRIGQTIGIDVSSIDPDSENVTYLIDWDDNGSIDETVESNSPTVKLTHSWSTLGERYIRVSSRDSRGRHAGGYPTFGIGIRIKIRVTRVEE